MNGMSIILLRMDASFIYKSFAINIADPKWSKPVAIKKIRATFLMFWIVFMRVQLYTTHVFLPLFMLTEDQVRHIAKLARIRLTDEEVKKFSKQLSGVLDYMDILNEVDTKNVAETSQVTGLKNVMEEDEVLPAQSGREELLKCSELPVDGNQIRVLRIVK